MSTVITPLDPFIRQRASFFEAGQAVMHLSLGRNNYDYIEIEPESEPNYRSLHRNHHPEIGLLDTPCGFADCISDTLYCASGWCGETIHDAIDPECHDHSDYWLNGSLDWIKFWDLINEDDNGKIEKAREALDHAGHLLGLGEVTHELLSEWQNVCESLVTKPRITGAIKRMAKKLDRDGVLFDFIDYFPGRMAQVVVKRLGRMWIKRYVSNADLRQQLWTSF